MKSFRVLPAKLPKFVLILSLYKYDFVAVGRKIFENYLKIFFVEIRYSREDLVDEIYNLDKRERTNAVWSKIGEENMYLEVTLNPVDQLIKINP